MGRAPCCDKANVNKGPWSPEEDGKLKHYIQTHGTTGGNWITLPQKAGLRRCGKSCRLRWLNYLRPNIKHGEFSDDEDKVICTLFSSIGSRWSIMAAQLPGRTDNDIKNYWNTKLKKKMMNNLISMPEIRKPFHHLQSLNSSTNYSCPSLSVFHNSNINVKAPILSSSTSSYVYSTNTFISSSPTTTAAIAASDHHQYPHNDPVVQQQGAKDSSTFFIFGGEQASSSYNSDGSFQYEYGGGTHVGVHDYKEFGRNYENEKGYYGDSSLDSSLEEIKKLISTNLCTNNMDNNLNLFVDDTKEIEKVAYY